MSNENQKKLGVNIAMIAVVLGAGTLMGWGATMLAGHKTVTVAPKVVVAPVKATPTPEVVTVAPIETADVTPDPAPEAPVFVPAAAPLPPQNLQDRLAATQNIQDRLAAAQNDPRIANNPQAQQMLQNIQDRLQDPNTQQQIQNLVQNIRQRGQGGGGRNFGGNGGGFAGGAGFGAGGGNFAGGQNGNADANNAADPTVNQNN